MAAKLFEYVIIHNSPIRKRDADEGLRPKSTILKPITSILAEDEAEVRIVAAREIPQEYMDRVAEVAITVRPFVVGK